MRRIKLIFTFVLFLMITLTLNLQSIHAEEVLPTSSIGTVVDYEVKDIDGLKYEYFDIMKENGYPGKIFNASFDPVNSKYEMVVADGYKENGWGNITTLDVAKLYEKETGKKVIAAVNGDFFGGKPIQPISTYVKDGVVYKLGGVNAFGFNSEGGYTTGVIPDEPSSWTYKVVIDTGAETKELIVDKINQVPLDGELAIYTAQNTTYTMSTPNTGKYIMKLDKDKDNNPIWGEYRPVRGFAYRLSKGEITTNDEVLVRDGYIGFEINNNQELLDWFYNNYNICTTTVKVYRVVAGEYANYDHYIGGILDLVVNGVAETFPDPTSFQSTPHPRTTIGVTTDGKFFITALDGRNVDWSQGFPSELQALVAKDLGAKYALNLDGGGSTTFVLRVGDELKVMNKPSDSALRADVNHVLIVEKTPSLNVTSTSNTSNVNNHEFCYIEDKIGIKNPENSDNNFNYNYVLISMVGSLVIVSGVILFKQKK